MKRKAIISLAVTLLVGVAAPALAKPAPPSGRAPATTTTTISGSGRHFK